MNALLFGLTLVSAATAQVANGVSAVPYSAVYGSAAASTSVAASSAAASVSNVNNGASTPSATVGAYDSAASSVITAAPQSSSSYDFYSAMPYSSFMSGGYKSLDCGYGYSKQSDGSCKPYSWYGQDQGCYETIIINK